MIRQFLNEIVKISSLAHVAKNSENEIHPSWDFNTSKCEWNSRNSKVSKMFILFGERKGNKLFDFFLAFIEVGICHLTQNNTNNA